MNSYKSIYRYPQACIYFETDLVKHLEGVILKAKVVKHNSNFNFPTTDIWKVFIKLSAGSPLSTDLTVMIQEDWTSKSKLLVEFNASPSIIKGRPAVFPMSV